MMTEQGPISVPELNGASIPAAKQKAKRKRRSPAVPWKKPKDMPKRPLSAYNLFFKDERERLVGGGSDMIDDAKMSTGGDGLMGDSLKVKQVKKAPGIGFANLAKTIAVKWKNLDPISRAPYEEVAGREKKKYDEAVAKWRQEQKVKAEEKAAKADIAKSASAKEFDEPLQHMPSDRSIGSFSDNSNAYPNEWFQANSQASRPEVDVPIPSYVNTVSEDPAASRNRNPTTAEAAFHLRQAMEDRYGSSFPIQTMVQLPSATALSLFSNIQSEEQLSDPSLANMSLQTSFNQATNDLRNRASSLMSLRASTLNMMHQSEPVADVAFSNSNASHVTQGTPFNPAPELPDAAPSMGFGNFQRAGHGFGENLHLQSELGHSRSGVDSGSGGSEDMALLRLQQQQQMQLQARQQQSGPQRSQTSMRNLSANLDEETIDFLTSLRYSG